MRVSRSCIRVTSSGDQQTGLCAHVSLRGRASALTGPKSNRVKLHYNSQLPWVTLTLEISVMCITEYGTTDRNVAQVQKDTSRFCRSCARDILLWYLPASLECDPGIISLLLYYFNRLFNFIFYRLG